MAKRPVRPAKHDNVPALVKKHIAAGAYLDTRHAAQRKKEREITLLEVLQVLGSGYHEKRKDKFEEQYNAWNYAIRGKTVDERELRICVSFEGKMLIITTIDLDAD